MRKIKYKRGALEMSFPWLFAILVGIFILFLAIYFITKYIGTEQTTLDAKTGKQIGIILNPLETSFESATTTYFTMPVETRVYNKCEDFGKFGEQGIQISQLSFNEWTETNVDVSFQNKYIFSEYYTEGKKFYVFSKPFEFPFKVADLIYLTSSSDNYCFIDAPSNIEEELSNLNQGNIRTENCSKSDIKVCFNGGDCAINVNYNGESVEKEGKTVYFNGDALMYAAIFSSKEVYECQLSRLMKRVESLSIIYNDKADFISRKGCDSNLDLFMLGEAAGTFDSSSDISFLNAISEEIKEANENNGGCRLW